MKKKVKVNLVQAISNDQGGWDVLMLTDEEEGKG